MIPRVIHQIHCGAPMSRDVRGWVRSIGEHHRDWSHVIWSEVLLKAVGINVAPLLKEWGNWASVSNFVRLRLLDKFGGWYLDTDMEALDSLDRLIMPDRALVAFQDGGRKCNAVMASVPGGEWVRWQIDHFHDYDPKDAASGVYLATAAEPDVGLIPQHYVYPWMYDSPPERRVPHPDSILCHHWLGSWTKR